MANNNEATRKWSELYKLDVAVPGEGKVVGQVEDFFVKESSQTIYALSVRTRVNGDLTVPVTGIKSIEGKRINLINAQMMTKAVPPFARGQNLLARKVVAENGSEVGTVKDIVLGVEPIVAMRVEGFEIAANGSASRRAHGFTAEAVARFDDDAIVIDERVAKKLR